MQLNPHPLLHRARAFARRLRGDVSGLAMIEFAFSFPLVLAMGGYGIEISNLALANLKISQYALNLADNASRVGIYSNLTTMQLREADINDVLAGTRSEGAGLKLGTNGRVTLSSLEGPGGTATQNEQGQLLHWQRCFGLKSGTGWDSTYGSAGTGTAGTVVPGGMGPAGAKVIAPGGSGVMFVEINYQYQPLFGTLFLSQRKLSYIASFIVRDRRDFTQVYNPAPTATASRCNAYTV